VSRLQPSAGDSQENGAALSEQRAGEMTAKATSRAPPPDALRDDPWKYPEGLPDGCSQLRREPARMSPPQCNGARCRCRRRGPGPSEARGLGPPDARSPRGEHGGPPFECVARGIQNIRLVSLATARALKLNLVSCLRSRERLLSGGSAASRCYAAPPLSLRRRRLAPPLGFADSPPRNSLTRIF